MHIKILDNTVLSAFRNDIRSVDVLSALQSGYPVLVTEGVMGESNRVSGGRPVPESLLKRSTEEAREASVALSKRFKRLHIGECTAIAESIFLSHEGCDNYIITDDGAARSVIERIGDTINVDDIFGFHVGRINLAGTVGLVEHLYRRGLLTGADCSAIADDLEHSTFRVPRGLLERLRGFNRRNRPICCFWSSFHASIV